MSSPLYGLAWLVVLLPLLGALSSFIAETPRRAAQICITFTVLALLIALTLLGYRMAHARTSAIPDESLVTFLNFRPDASELTIFPGDFHPQFGVRVDNLSTGFMALVAFLSAMVQGLGSALLRGDAAYRRFFWVGSALTTGVLAVIASPNLFQTWLGMGLISVTTLMLALHWWQRDGMAQAARRGFLVLLVGDLCLLLGLVFQIAKMGAFTGNLSPPPNQDVTDPYSYQLVTRAWDAAHNGLVAGVGSRSLFVLAALFVVAALIHSAQAPATLWLTSMIEAPLAVLGLLAVSLLAGVVLLARVYPLLLDATGVLSILAIVAATGAVVLSGLCVLARDLYRVIVLSVTAQLALAITALGVGGYSPGLLIAFVSAPLSTLLVVVAGSLVRAYRTRDIHEMGGAWTRMRRTSTGLAFWAVATGGVNLGGYDVLSAVFRNQLPNGGQLGVGVIVVVAVLTLIALVLTAAYAFRVLFTVCAGAPVRRRGFAVERIAEAEPRLRRLRILATAVGVVAILVGIPGISSFNLGHTHVPGLTFSHWIYLGGVRQVLPLSAAGLLLALFTFAAGGVVGRVLGIRRLDVPARLERLRRLPYPGALRPLHWAGAAVSAMTVNVDDSILEPLLDAPGGGMDIAAAPLSRVRVRQLRVGLAAALLVVLVLVAASVLAASGHLPVHTI